eukprot:INCI17798.2.p1 GENE.INCI17798.2~~INCI17798.2.p1  ORF type:complete len:306 (+),score=53.30 INCI17798.2:323-1240(+)
MSKQRKTGVRPSVLEQFYDAPPASSSSQRRSRTQKIGSRKQQGNQGFGSAERGSLNDQRALKTVDPHGKLGGAFGRADFDGEEVCLPRTEAQKILKREVDDRKDDEIYVVVPEHYTIGGVVPPTNEKMKVPKLENEYLMTPQQRRELNLYHVKKNEAAKLQRKARADKHRMLDLMRMQYPDGVIGLGSVEPKYGERIPNPYGQKVQAAASAHERAVAAQEARKQNIVAKSDSLQRRGYTFLQQTGDAPIQQTIAGRKGAGVQPSNNTHSRLFERQEYTHNPARAAVLRQHETRGRSYDPITGVAR